MGGSAPRRDGHLPVETTSFVDRRGELADGRELLARARLVTLTGPGGVGKTRLAGRIASRVARAFPDGVCFVHLSGVHDPALVPLAVADALGLRDHSARPPVDTLVERLRDRRLLLVVDNCEHLLPACAALAGALLHGTTGVRILATSRHRLGLTEEHLMDVRPLPVPDPDGDLSAADGYPALALFADRAAAVLPGFRLTAANRESVARLCRRLDGLPLAIELAAVRMRVLDVDQLLARLDDRYRLLTAGSPTAAPRHQTLRAAVAWSHDLCGEAEQRVWARLSVLPGGFDLETAEAVCADRADRANPVVPSDPRPKNAPFASIEAPSDTAADTGADRRADAADTGAGTGGGTGADGTAGRGERAGNPHPPPLQPYDILDAVAGLVDKSVLCREGDPAGGARYRLLDTLREYGLERLREHPGEEHATRTRLRDWMQQRAATCERDWFGPDQPAIVTRLRADRDTLRAALDFSLTTPGEALAGLRLAGTLWFHWHACGAPREGRYWLDRALAANPEPTRERARALWAAGLLAGCPEDLTRGRHRAEQARDLAHRLGDAAEAAHADYVIGVIRLFSDDLEGALDHFRTGVDRGRVPGQHLSLVGLDRVELACALSFLGRADEAITVCEQTRGLCAGHGEQWVLSYVERMLALAHTVKGDWERAEHHGREALRLKLAVHDVVGMGLTLDLLARVTAERGGVGRRAAGAVERGVADRRAADRKAGDRGAVERMAVDRGAAVCGAEGRGVADRAVADRTAGGRGVVDRGDTDLTAAGREVTDREIADRGSADRGATDRGTAGQGEGLADCGAVGRRSHDDGAADRAARDCGVADGVVHDRGAADHAAHDCGAADQAARGRGAADQAARGRGAADQAARGRGAADHAAPDHRAADRTVHDRGAHERAAVLLGAADRAWADVDPSRWGSAALNATRRAAEERARRALGRTAFRRAYDRGAALALADAVRHALDAPDPAARRRPPPPPPWGTVRATGPAPYDRTPSPAPPGRPPLATQDPHTPPASRTSPAGPAASRRAPVVEAPADALRLTRREAQVAELVAEGLANQQIADRLVIARRTAEGHVERILSKLGFSNRSQIAAWVTAQR
ncbi:LuxR C-terminal-related transcriptional regulator [Streptomyces sp. NPDC006259]|uniref:LuxR C-terminal-related transcriptional regulator n=1 Tax=Streptomyces sp. NPDC006259 TaxID=3364740 RepID=UPI003697220F